LAPAHKHLLGRSAHTRESANRSFPVSRTMQFMRTAIPLSTLLVLLCTRACSAAALGSPVEKVVNLLKEMKEQLQEDGKKEQSIYDKYACWCETATDRKAKAITDAKTKLESLGQEILGSKGKVATRTSEIEKLTADIKENEQMQKEATAARQKENEEFMAETSEMKQAIAALDKAITVLKAATAGSALLQGGSKASASVKAATSQALHGFRAAMAAAPVSATAKMPAAKLALLRTFASEVAHGEARYSPQSETIQGILSEMFDTFTEDVETKTSAEASRNRKFEDLIAEKQEALEIMQEDMSKKEAEKAEAEKMLAEATQDYDDTDRQMQADVEFFDKTKEQCIEKSKAWAERKKLREEEIEAVKKAIEILSSDEAREVFDKSDSKPESKSFFLQEGLVQISNSAPVKNAFRILKEKATLTHSLRLASLAATVRTCGGKFDKVLEAIDKMIKTLKEEGEEDVKKRDQCKEQYQKINSTVSDLQWKVEVNDAKIAKLEKKIEKSKAEKEQTIKDIEQVQKDLKEMKDNRENENQAFLEAKKADEDAIKLIKEAKDVLAEFYSKNKMKISFAQGGKPEFEEDPDKAPEFKLTEKGKRKGQAKGILGLMDLIMGDLKDDIAADIKAEEKAQKSYEKAKTAAEKLEKELETKKNKPGGGNFTAQ